MRLLSLLLCLFAGTTSGQTSSFSSSSSVAGAQCLDRTCFALFWAPRSFQEASLECQKGGGGLLMTVRSTVAAEAIALLFQRGGQGRAWLGLFLPEGSCLDPGKTLRGFQWVSGEERTDYSAWGGPSGMDMERGDPVCSRKGPLCVAVTPELLWEERDCHSPAVEGFLCEYSYPGGTCAPLNPGPSLQEKEKDKEEVVVLYFTPFGARETDLLALPPGSSAHLPHLGLTLECHKTSKDGAPLKWVSSTKGAWDCRVENGGCEGECLLEDGDGTPKCSCPEGLALMEEDRRGCSSPCDLLGCQQECVVQGPSAACMCWEGFVLASDGRSCLDVDDCQADPGPCDQECLNTPGGFQCLCSPGFEMVEGRCQEARWRCFDLGCQQECALVEGAHRCVCFEGFAPDPDQPHQCLMVCNRSQCPPRCDPHTGNDCHCPQGFILDVNDDGSKVCEDISECDSGYCGELDCINTPGSYYCLCPNGSRVQDGKFCEDQDGAEMEGSGETDLYPSRTPVATPVPPKDEESHRRGMLVGTIVSTTLMGVLIVAILCYLVRKHRSARSRKDGTCQQAESGVVLQHVSSNSASSRLKV